MARGDKLFDLLLVGGLVIGGYYAYQKGLFCEIGLCPDVGGGGGLPEPPVGGPQPPTPPTTPPWTGPGPGGSGGPWPGTSPVNPPDVPNWPTGSSGSAFTFEERCRYAYENFGRISPGCERVLFGSSSVGSAGAGSGSGSAQQVNCMEAAALTDRWIRGEISNDEYLRKIKRYRGCPGVHFFG